MATEMVPASPLGPALPPPPAGLSCVGSTVQLVKQVQLTWCWAAVGLCLLEFFRRNSQGLDLCGVARKLLGAACPAGCTNRDCLATQDVPVVLAALGLSSAPYTIDARLPALLAAGCLVASEVSSGNDTHVVVVHHFCQATNNVLVMDPRADWDTHEGDLNLFVRKEHRSFLLTPASNPMLAGGAMAAAVAAPLATGVRTDQPLIFRSPEQVLALARPVTERLSLPDALHDEAAAPLSPSAADTWLPRLCWSSQDVLVGDFGKVAFLGWRQIFESGGAPNAAVDAVTDDAGQHVFEKRSRGKAVEGIAKALTALTAYGVDLMKVSLFEVPCLALHMLRYETGRGQQMLRGAYSLWDEFRGDMDVATFVAKAKARAIKERVTSHV